MPPSCPLGKSATSSDLSRKGFELARDGFVEDGLACHRRATSAKHKSVRGSQWFHRARVEQHLGREAESMQSFSRATQLGGLHNEEELESYFSLGSLLRSVGNPTSAEAAYRHVLKKSPVASGAHIMLAVALRDGSYGDARVDESLHHYTVGLRLRPDVPGGQYNYAQALYGIGRKDEAASRLRLTLKLAPAMHLAYDALADAIQERDVRGAVKALRSSLTILPSNADAYYGLAKIQYTNRQLAGAIDSHHHALRLRPDFAFVHNDLGNALADQSGRDDEVLHHYTEAARLLPEFAEAQSNVGTLLKEMQRYPEAAATFEKAIRVKPVLCEAYKNLGSCQQELGRPVDSMRTFRQALDINPQFWPAMYALLDQAHFLCDWKGREGLYRTLRNHLTALQTRGDLGAGPDERLHGGLAPFNAIMWPLPIETVKAVTANRASKDVALAAAAPLSPPLRWRGGAAAAVGADGGDGGGLRLGLLSADFGDHPVGHALLPWLRALRRSTGLTLLCFASDSAEKRHAGTPLRRAIATAAHHFVDVTGLSDEAAARTINDLRVHVLINLVGHTAGHRGVMLEHRPAPVQAMHYGFPSTTALPSMSYMLLDRVAAPPELHNDFTERMAYFPYSHFVAVHAARYPHVPAATRRAHPWAADRAVSALSDGTDARRGDLGMPLSASMMEGVALCNFNQLYKMDPSTVQAWAGALRRLGPGASLWLSRVSVRRDSSKVAEVKLTREAAALGVGRRLMYAWKFPEEDYLSFRALADVWVDNRMYNAHTTGADTLWAGLPAVVLQSRHLAGRAAASFVSALGTASSVAAPGLRDYENAIAEVGKRGPRLWKLRRRVLEAREASPFFDLDRLARAQERLAHAMWRVHAAGYAPMHLVMAR